MAGLVWEEGRAAPLACCAAEADCLPLRACEIQMFGDLASEPRVVVDRALAIRSAKVPARSETPPSEVPTATDPARVTRTREARSAKLPVPKTRLPAAPIPMAPEPAVRAVAS